MSVGYVAGMDAVDKLLTSLPQSLARRATAMKDVCFEYTYSDEVCWLLQDALLVIGQLKSEAIVVQGAQVYEITGDDAEPVLLDCWTARIEGESLDEYRARSHPHVVDFLNSIAHQYKDSWRVILSCTEWRVR